MPENDPQKKRPDKAEAENDEASKRSYYYDDAHGYEEYDPDKEPDDDELEDEE
ncbi:MAG: hypothetical protein IPM21_14520 [Acidobacteria bacterium]|nr:hypothetical protein [Acidobacteriota bacterium]